MKTWSLLMREEPTCLRTNKPTRLHYWACALKPVSCACWATRQSQGACAPSAHALRREEPLPQEAWASHREKSSHSNKDLAQPEINKWIKFLKKSIKKILLKQSYCVTLQSHSRAYTQRKTWSERIHAPQSSLEHCSQQPTHGRDLNIHWQRSR